MSLGEVDLLARNVSSGVPAQGRFLAPELSRITPGGSPLSLREWHGHEHAEVPEVDEFAA